MKYKELDFSEYNYISDEISDEIDVFDNDNDIINSTKRKKGKINNSDIGKHIKITNRIGVLITCVSNKNE